MNERAQTSVSLRTSDRYRRTIVLNFGHDHCAASTFDILDLFNYDRLDTDLDSKVRGSVKRGGGECVTVQSELCGWKKYMEENGRELNNKK